MKYFEMRWIYPSDLSGNSPNPQALKVPLWGAERGRHEEVLAWNLEEEENMLLSPFPQAIASAMSIASAYYSGTVIKWKIDHHRANVSWKRIFPHKSPWIIWFGRESGCNNFMTPCITSYISGCMFLAILVLTRLFLCACDHGELLGCHPSGFSYVSKEVRSSGQYGISPRFFPVTFSLARNAYITSPGMYNAHLRRMMMRYETFVGCSWFTIWERFTPHEVSWGLRDGISCPPWISWPPGSGTALCGSQNASRDIERYHLAKQFWMIPSTEVKRVSKVSKSSTVHSSSIFLRIESEFKFSDTKSFPFPSRRYTEKIIHCTLYALIPFADSLPLEEVGSHITTDI